MYCILITVTSFTISSLPPTTSHPRVSTNPFPHSCLFLLCPTKFNQGHLCDHRLGAVPSSVVSSFVALSLKTCLPLLQNISYLYFSRAGQNHRCPLPGSSSLLTGPVLYIAGSSCGCEIMIALIHHSQETEFHSSLPLIHSFCLLFHIIPRAGDVVVFRSLSIQLSLNLSSWSIHSSLPLLTSFVKRNFSD